MYRDSFYQFFVSKTVKKHPAKPHYFIIVNPAMDGFILTCAKEEEIDMEKLGLSGELDEFIKRTKTKKTKKDVGLITLIKGIKQADEIKILKGWLKYLNEKSYDADPVELIRIDY